MDLGAPWRELSDFTLFVMHDIVYTILWIGVFLVILAIYYVHNYGHASRNFVEVINESSWFKTYKEEGWQGIFDRMEAANKVADEEKLKRRARWQ